MTAVMEIDVTSNDPSTFIFRHATGKPGQLTVAAIIKKNEIIVAAPTYLNPLPTYFEYKSLHESR